MRKNIATATSKAKSIERVAAFKVSMEDAMAAIFDNHRQQTARYAAAATVHVVLACHHAAESN